MKNINKLLLDKEFRKQLREDKSAISTLYQYNKEDVEYKVVTNSKDKIYVVIPNEDLYLNLENINAAATHTVGSGGSVSTVGTLSTAGSYCTCASSLGSAASAGSISTAGTINVN